MEIALFDVDGTLLRGYSGFPLTLELIRLGKVRWHRLPLALFYRTLASFLYWGDIRKMYEIALEDLAGMSAQEISEIGEKVFQKYLKPLLYVEGIEEIKKHQAARTPVYLISSGPNLIIEALSRFLKVDGAYGIGPVIQNGIVQKRLCHPFTYKEGKIEAAEIICKKHQSSLEECYFYADSVQDKYLLSAVGKPRAVNPDLRLLPVAQKNKWPIIQFKKVLGDFN